MKLNKKLAVIISIVIISLGVVVLLTVNSGKKQTVDKSDLDEYLKAKYSIVNYQSETIDFKDGKAERISLGDTLEFLVIKEKGVMKDNYRLMNFAHILSEQFKANDSEFQGRANVAIFYDLFEPLNEDEQLVVTDVVKQSEKVIVSIYPTSEVDDKFFDTIFSVMRVIKNLTGDKVLLEYSKQVDVDKTNQYFNERTIAQSEVKWSDVDESASNFKTLTAEEITTAETIKNILTE